MIFQSVPTLARNPSTSTIPSLQLLHLYVKPLTIEKFA